MASAKGKLMRLLGGVVLRGASVAAADDVHDFRRIVLRGDAPAPRAGMKLQILLPTDDVRTYTPIPSPEGVTLLGWTHAGGPGARWLSAAKVGDSVRFIGPQRSLHLPPGPVILVGDETSVAVAASFEAERPGQVHAVFEAGDVEGVAAAAQAVGLDRAAVVPRGAAGDAAESVIAARAAAPDSLVAVTGGSEVVIAVRSALRARGIRRITTKAYWIPGRTGLD